MSASASGTNTSQDSHNIQASTQGASGAGSPTITAGGAVSSINNDPTLQLKTVQELSAVAKAALGQAGQSVSDALGSVNQAGNAVSSQAAQQSTDNNQLLSAVLASENNLASYQGSGGAIQQSQSTNYLIWGAIAIAVALIFSLRRSH